MEFVDVLDDKRNLIMDKSQENGSTANEYGKNKKRELISSNEEDTDANNNESVHEKS